MTNGHKRTKPTTKIGKQRARVVRAERRLSAALRERPFSDEKEDLPVIANPLTSPDRKLH
jgi:hypothetical protein